MNNLSAFLDEENLNYLHAESCRRISAAGEVPRPEIVAADLRRVVAEICRGDDEAANNSRSLEGLNDLALERIERGGVGEEEFRCAMEKNGPRPEPEAGPMSADERLATWRRMARRPTSQRESDADPAPNGGPPAFRPNYCFDPQSRDASGAFRQTLDRFAMPSELNRSVKRLAGGSPPGVGNRPLGARDPPPGAGESSRHTCHIMGCCAVCDLETRDAADEGRRAEVSPGRNLFSFPDMPRPGWGGLAMQMSSTKRPFARGDAMTETLGESALEAGAVLRRVDTEQVRARDQERRRLRGQPVWKPTYHVPSQILR